MNGGGGFRTALSPEVNVRETLGQALRGLPRRWGAVSRTKLIPLPFHIAMMRARHVQPSMSFCRRANTGFSWPVQAFCSCPTNTPSNLSLTPASHRPAPVQRQIFFPMGQFTPQRLLTTYPGVCNYQGPTSIRTTELSQPSSCKALTKTTRIIRD